MTQVNAAVAPTTREKLETVTSFRSSLESLMVVGQSFLSQPSLEDASAVAFTTLTEDVLEPAGLETELQKIDGVTDPAAKVELIMQDIIQPQLTTVAMLEEHLATKAEGEIDTPFTTRDKMTAQASLESMEQVHDQISTFATGLGIFREMASMEGITVDHVRGLAVHFVKQIPDIAAQLSISVEELAETQVLGELTDAVDRISQVVNNARETAETNVNDARALNDEITSAGEGGDIADALYAKTRTEGTSGVKVDEGTQVSSTPSDDSGNATNNAGENTSGDDAPPLNPDEAPPAETDGTPPAEEPIDEEAAALAAAAADAASGTDDNPDDDADEAAKKAQEEEEAARLAAEAEEA